MKASELRCGNYVYFEDELLKFDFEMGWNFDYIKSIPLTEEWLLKFGFIKKYQTFEFKGLNIDGTVVHFSFDKWRSEYDIENCDFTEIPAECKYVHQLQNLYFALTNEEL